MSSTITDALWITLIGMGLVFIALLLLWGMMALMVNWIPRLVKTGPGDDAESSEEPAVIAEEAAEAAPDTNLLKQKAAAVAVAVALELQNKTNGHRVGLPKPEPFSAWQSVMRSNRLSQRSRMFIRKS